MSERWYNRLPSAIRFILLVFSIITLVFWLGVFVYKIIDTARKLIHWLTDSRNWWTFVVCILILGIGILLASQFVFNLDPVGKVVNWFNETKDGVKEWLINLIEGSG